MHEEDSREPPAEESLIIPMETADGRAYLSVRRLDAAGSEEEIAARLPSFDEVVGKVTALAGGAVDRLRATGASKVVLEFGCEIGVESGQLVTVIAKASGKATFKVGLEWSAPKTAS